MKNQPNVFDRPESNSLEAVVVEALGNPAILRQYILVKHVQAEYHVPLYCESKAKVLFDVELGDEIDDEIGYVVAIYKPTGRMFFDNNHDAQYEYEYQGVRVR